ncbi:hypothetical protein HAX54_023062, partial [Datura stramonium]|nr:hypothetical protein [Datura stramonium]
EKADNSHGIKTSGKVLEQIVAAVAPIHLVHETLERVFPKPAHYEGFYPMHLVLEPTQADSPGRSTSRYISDHNNDRDSNSENSVVHVMKDLVTDSQEIGIDTKGNQEAHEPIMISAYNPRGIQLEVDLSNWVNTENNANINSDMHETTRADNDGHHMVTRHKAKKMLITHTSLAVETLSMKSDTVSKALVVSH